MHKRNWQIYWVIMIPIHDHTSMISKTYCQVFHWKSCYRVDVLHVLLSIIKVSSTYDLGDSKWAWLFAIIYIYTFICLAEVRGVLSLLRSVYQWWTVWVGWRTDLLEFPMQSYVPDSVEGLDPIQKGCQQ